MNDTIEAHVLAAATAWTSAPALSGLDGPPMAFADLAASVARVRGGLRLRGISREDRVAVVLPQEPGAASLAVALACSAVCVPLRPGMAAEELDQLFQRLSLRALALPAGLADAARDAAARRGLPVLKARRASGDGGISLAGPDAGPVAPDRPAAPDDLCLIHATSGVTGVPKLVPRTHRNVLGAPVSGVRRPAWDGLRRALLPIPISHMFGMKFLLSAVTLGVELIFPAEPSAHAILRAAERRSPACIPMTPAMLAGIIDALPAGCSNPGGALVAIMIGSAASDASILAAAAERLDARVIHTYGSSECGMVAIDLPDAPSRPGASGAAVADIRIVDADDRDLPAGAEGEILVRGPEVFPGYLDDPAANAAAFAPGGWFRTGDAGRLDADGYLFVAGRLDDRINRGGQKIDPREVEEILLAHPAVAECAVFGVPHAALGADVAAVVVLRPGAAAGVRELRRWALDRLSPHKAPRRIVIVDALPRTPTGKVRRAALPGLLPAAPDV